MYNDVDAVTDLPAAIWYEEIHQAFPDAKVILSVRDSEEIWIKSCINNTFVYRNTGFLKKMIMWYIIPYTKGIDFPFFEDIRMSAFGTLRPEFTVLHKKNYREHNERVQAVIPKEKLLIFNVKQGWKPLCEFLGCEIPDQEFPRVNVAGSLAKKGIQMIRNDLKNMLFIILAVFAFLASIFYLMCSF